MPADVFTYLIKWGLPRYLCRLGYSQPGPLLKPQLHAIRCTLLIAYSLKLSLSGIMRRLALEIASQAVPVATTILDRVFFAAIALRAWGLDGFEYWSLILSVTSLLTIFDAGCLQNFANRITSAMARGDPARAIDVYQQSNFIFLIIGFAAAASAAVLALSSPLQSVTGIAHPQFASQALLVVLGLGLATALRLVAMNFMAVYRANLSYGRGTVVFALTEIIRILLLCTVIALGASIAATAIFYLLLTGVALAGIAHFDIGRRFPDFRYRIVLPRGDALKGSLRMALAFGLPLLPVMAMQQAPVLLLGAAAAAGAGLVASFVLLRTLSNLARTIVYKAVNVLAMDLVRHGVKRGEETANRLGRRINSLVAFVFGCIGGGLLSYGETIIGLWSCRPSLFDPIVLAVMLMPMVLTPSLMLAQTVLQYRNTPKVWSIGAFVHGGLAILLYFSLPIDDILLSVSVAVYGGEMLGLGLPVLWASAGCSWREMLRREVGPTFVSIGALLAVIALSWCLTRIVAPTSFEGILFHFITVGAVFSVNLIWLLRYSLSWARSILSPIPADPSSGTATKAPRANC